MVYNWAQVTNELITNLYLYGQTTTPTDLVSDSIIRPTDNLATEADNTTTQVDMASYMTTGPGRFALGSQSSMIEAFFSTATDLSWAVGHSYNKTEFYDALKSHGLDVGYYGINIKQVYLDDFSGDYWQRAYIWNSGAFKLDDGVRFVVDANGTRHIENYAIVPDENILENFDFNGGGTIAEIANSYLKPNIDPWDIGRKVNIDFVGNITQTRSYTYADYHEDVVIHADELIAGAIKASSILIGAPEEILSKLWDGGVTKFLSQDNKTIIYGTNNADTIISVKT